MDELHSLFEAIGDSAVLLDRSGRIVDWNQGATSLFGYHKKEVLGRSINLVYRQNYPFPKIINETLTHQKRWIAETNYVRKNGITGTCQTTASLVHFANNKTQTLLTHHNITALKQSEFDLQKTTQKFALELCDTLELFYINNALLIKNLGITQELEQQLRESELRFHLLAENATDIISRHAPDGTYLYASPSCKVLLGLVPEELMGITIYKFMHQDDVPKLKKIFNRRKRTAIHHTLTYRIRRKEGDYRWFESNFRPIFDENIGIIREVQIASRDITDRVLDKKARLRGQQLAHVFRLSTMEEMASGMAHEISQPLAAVVNYTQGCVRYLEKGTTDTAQLTEIMNKAVAQAERAGEVIHRLKNFFCKGQLIKTPCKISSLIREAVSLMRSDLNNSKTKVEFDFAKDAQLISADHIQVQQVVLNLIQNAIESMKTIDRRQRRIYIQTRRGGSQGSIEITVRDSGAGFSKDMVHKVFEPFFTTKAHGRGMGLAICRSIIEAHGGEFTINPNTHNHSWIRFILPVN